MNSDSRPKCVSLSFILALILTLSILAIGCGGSDGGGDGDGGGSGITLNDFVGTWSGSVNFKSVDENFSADVTITVNSNSTGTVYIDFESNDYDKTLSFNVIDDELHFNLPNDDPTNPDCANWNISATLELNGLLQASGIACSPTGGKSVTISGILTQSDGGGGGGGSPPSLEEDSINIISISPQKYYEGRFTIFQITVNYNLVSRQAASINLYFNLDGTNSYDSRAATDVTYGSGTLSLTGNATFVDNGNAGDYLVNAQLHYNNATAYARDSQILQVVPPVQPITPGDYTNPIGMTFNLINSGSFTMGSPESELGRSPSETQHLVGVSPFYIQTTEVTQGQWKAIMGTNPSFYNSCGDDCPVENVSWNYIQDNFITSLNALGWGTYRFPTEAEWECAARAGSTTALANGDISVTDCSYDANMNEIGWYCGNAGGTPHPVAQKIANDWGLYDMHGSVLEWIKDWYQNDLGSDFVINPTGPSSGSSRVMRSSWWNDSPDFGRSAARSGYDPNKKQKAIGFRLVVRR